MTTGLRSALDGRALSLVAVGGSAGAALRWAITTWFDTGGSFPWTTLGINVAGCLALGLLLGVPESVRLGLGVGFCGGLTTFSTFTVEAARLVDEGSGATAVGYLTASLVLGLLAVWAGWRLAPRS